MPLPKSAVLWCLIPALFLACAGRAATTLSNDNARVTLGAGTTVKGTGFGHEQIVSIGSYAAGPLAVPLPARVGIDAIMIASNIVYFSTDAGVTLGGTNFADEDIIAYDPGAGTFSMFWDGSFFSLLDLPEGADLDALIWMQSEHSFLASFDRPFIQAATGDRFDANDVLLWLGGVFTNYLDGATDLGIPDRCNLDALHRIGQDLFFSLDTTAVIASMTGTQNTVWCYDMTGHTVSQADDLPLGSQGDLAGLDHWFDSDGDGLSDFEELSGQDEGGTTWTPNTVPLGPNGYHSLTNVVDSDGDGLTDGQEAFTGTNPTNANDYLHITSIAKTETNRFAITWTSVSNRLYHFEGATNSAPYTPIAGPIVAAPGSQTTYTNASNPNLRFYRVVVKP